MNKELTQEEIDALMNGIELPKKSTNEVKVEEPDQPNSSGEKEKSQVPEEDRGEVKDEEKDEEKYQGNDRDNENKS